MKKDNVLLIYFALFTGICYSQSNKELTGNFESKTKYVYGYSEDFRDNVYLGISFGKGRSSYDTTYYIKFQIRMPETDFRSDIEIRKSSMISIIPAHGKKVDLKLTKVKSSIDKDKLTDDPFAPTLVYDHTTTLILPISKKEIIDITKEPFYRIVLPYYNNSAGASSEIVFTSPTLFVRRDFLPKNAKYIIEL